MSASNLENPPKILVAILRRIVEEPYRESLVGDFEEVYKFTLERRGVLPAIGGYTLQIVKLYLVNVWKSFLWGPVMFRNYIKIALRYLFRNRVFSVVNISGLTFGFACFILLALFVKDELSFDMFHEDAKDIYRIIQKIEEPDGEIRLIAGVAPMVGREAEKQFPEVLSQTQVLQIGRLTVGNDPQVRDYERIWIADEHFFNFFDFQFIYGDPEKSLSAPDNLVITESVAIKYFGNRNVLGERLFTNRFNARISGVIKDFPANSHININTFHAEPTWAREISSWNEWVSTNWTSNAFITYVKMRQGFDKDSFEEKLTSLVSSHYGDEIEYESTFILQPLSEIHLHSGNIHSGLNVNKGNPLYVYMFSIVGVLILLIACFNYMNLSTALATHRTREVGMRKTLGAGKSQLVLQFTGEAFIVNLCSLLFAILLLIPVIPLIGGFLGKELSMPINEIIFIGGLVFVTLISGVGSALYPSFFLSKLNPASVLRQGIKIGSKKSLLRKILVIAQFSISIIMITATLIIYQQLSFLQQKELGFQVENLLVVDINSGALRGQFESIKQEFKRLSEVKNVTVSSRVPGEWKFFPVANATMLENDAKAQAIFIGIDEDFLSTYDIDLIEGRNLRNDQADSNSVILTRLMVRKLGLENPVGSVLEINSALWNGDLSELDHPYNPRIVGVVDDFYFESFRKEMRPLILASYRNPIHNIDYYTLRLETTNWNQTKEKLQSINASFDPENPLEYTFLDNQFEQFYKGDRIRARLFLIFSCIIIFIACMGFFAIASLVIESRIKEIGIRKVMGAKIKDIIWLLSSDFALLVGVAFVISAPVAWWAAWSWLQEFAYRISIPLWAFPVAGVTAFLIAMGTIMSQTIRAANNNPVDSLRNE